MNYRQKEDQLDFQTAIRQLNEMRVERDRYKKALTEIIDRSNRFSNSIAYKIAIEAIGNENIEEGAGSCGVRSKKSFEIVK